jgi:Fe2+ or Zn2+ uptake regulation protein
VSSREKLAEFMAKLGRHLTQHQGAVAETIFAMPGAFTAEDVAGVHEGEISRVTVHRVLNLFAKADVLRRATLSGTDAFVMKTDE